MDREFRIGERGHRQIFIFMRHKRSYARELLLIYIYVYVHIKCEPSSSVEEHNYRFNYSIPAITSANLKEIESCGYYCEQIYLLIHFLFSDFHSSVARDFCTTAKILLHIILPLLILKEVNVPYFIFLCTYGKKWVDDWRARLQDLHDDDKFIFK